MATLKDFPVSIVDVSANQDDPATSYKPTLDKLKAAGIMAIIVRAGYGKVIDRLFRYFWGLAKGLFERMVYWYIDYYSFKWMGLTEEQWGDQQAEVLYNATKADPGEGPMKHDCEESPSGWKITIFNRHSYNRVARACVEGHERRAGTKDEIYTSPGFLWVFEDWAKDRALHLAWYNRSITLDQILAKVRAAGWRGKVTIWQYTSDGDINNDGIADGRTLGMETEGLDFNVFLGSMEEWSRYCGKAPAPVIPPAEDPVVIEPPKFAETVSVSVGTIICPSGLNVRSEPKTGADNIVSWLLKDAKVEILEVKQIGEDFWARVGVNQWTAIRYNGVEYIV